VKNSNTNVSELELAASTSPFRLSKNFVLTPGNTQLFLSTAPTAATKASASKSSSLPQTSSLQRSLIGGLGIGLVNCINNRNNTTELLSSRQTTIDWADVRLTIPSYSETESLDALYRPLAVPRLLKPSFDDVVKRIRVLWNQLRYPIAQRGSVTKKMSNMTKENYMLLVSHMLLLQAAHRHLVNIVNKIRKDLGEDPIGVGTGSHLTPKRPTLSPPSSSNLPSPRRGMRIQKFGKKKKRKDSSTRGSPRNSPSRGSPRGTKQSRRRSNDQWKIDLSTSISQLKGLIPWVQEFIYRGESYA
jgi:hypothetical protein